ncbi:MAG: large conductance mechanosensitive channel protein MscL [Gammaproteobacteria bacterium]
MSLISEFKAFAMRGNVVDLSIAVIMGAAFGKIVTSLVDGILMPLIGLILGGINITEKSFVVGHAVIKWGLFLQSVIDFTLISFAIFLMVKGISKFYKTTGKVTSEISLLTDIRDLLEKSSNKS